MGKNNQMNQLRDLVTRQVSGSEDPPPKTFTPTGSLVALHVFPPKPFGEIELPDGSTNPTQSPICYVIAVGPKCEQVKQGQKVLIHPHAIGPDIFNEGGKYIILKEEVICGIIDEPESTQVSPPE